MYIYISKARLRKGGVIIPDANLDQLPKSVIEKALKQKVIKKEKDERSSKTEESTKG